LFRRSDDGWLSLLVALSCVPIHYDVDCTKIARAFLADVQLNPLLHSFFEVIVPFDRRQNPSNVSSWRLESSRSNAAEALYCVSSFSFYFSRGSSVVEYPRFRPTYLHARQFYWISNIGAPTTRPGFRPLFEPAHRFLTSPARRPAQTNQNK